MAGKTQEPGVLGSLTGNAGGVQLTPKIGVTYCGNGEWEFFYVVPAEVRRVFNVASRGVERGSYAAPRRAFLRILRHYPFFTDALNLVGSMSAGRGRYLKALGYYRMSLEVSAAAMPQGFFGRLPWRRPNNRPFWRGVQGALVCLVNIGMLKEAKDLLSWASQFYCQDWVPISQLAEELGVEAR